jgi:glycerol-3-phosphate cytidylyltransferase-like family protein
MLKECKDYCDHLTIGLNAGILYDPIINPSKRKPIFSLEERKLVLNSCKYVDEIITYSDEKDLIKIMSEGVFQIRFLGDDYAGKHITGANLINEIYYINRDHGYSTSQLIKRINHAKN